MTRLFLAVLLLFPLAASRAAAHPGMGIVVAPDGTVTFTDVGRQVIWRVSPEGELRAVGQERWSHALQLADDGSIFYEREEPGEGTVPYSFWRLRPDGSHEMLVPPVADRSDFTGGVFHVDEDRNIYFAWTEQDRGGVWRARIKRRAPDGTVTPFTGLAQQGPQVQDGPPGEASIRIVTAMTPGPGGSFYIADRDHIRRVETRGPEAGRVTTIASGIIDPTPADPPLAAGPPTTVNRIHGLGAAEDGTVFAAYPAGRRVVRVDPSGEVRVVRETEGDWSPIGVASRDGVLHVLEVHDESIRRLRLWRIAPGEEARKLAELAE